MSVHLKIGDITLEVVRKDIKHAYLRVVPPAGEVHISAPKRMSNAALRAFALSRLGWIQRQQAKIRTQVRETPRRYVEGESLDVWGVRKTLKVTEVDAPPSVALHDGHLQLQLHPGTETHKRQALVEAWYREQLMAAVPALLARWEPLIGVKVKRVTLRRMKTRWGSCSTKPRTIRLNSELAKKPPECLEYVVVHELVHLLEASHNARFKALMDRYLPGWKVIRKQLNSLTVKHTDWPD